MAGQTSKAVLFRAVVMLACLVAIPLAAIFGTSLREMFTTVFGNRWASDTASANAALVEAPPFNPSLAGQPPNPVPMGADVDPMPPTRLPPTDPLANPAPGVVSVDFEASTASPGTSPPPHANMAPAANERQSPGLPAAEAVRPENGVAAPGAASDRFGDVEGRLRQLGATRYWLEAWGRDQAFYRFRCEVALGGNSDFVRYFEATSPDRRQSMAQVLREIEAWRSAPQ